MQFRSILSHVLGDLADIVVRLATRGPRAAGVCFLAHWTNLCALLAGRLAREARVRCPCCGWQGHAFNAIDLGRCVLPNCECPQCHAYERHRFLHLYLDRYRPGTFSPGRIVLHFAPEDFVRRFAEGPDGPTYLCTDLEDEKLLPVPAPRFRSDLQAMALCDGAVDGIVCIHVLEHIPNDRQALAEIKRILRPGGEALIMVPFGMHLDATLEHAEPDEELFGHVRDYSPKDFKERLADFHFEKITPAALLGDELARKHGIPESQILYRCTKAACETSGSE